MHHRPHSASLLTAALALAAAGAVPQTAAGAERDRCDGRRGSVIDTDASWRLLSRHTVSATNPDTTTDRLYSCDAKTGRMVRVVTARADLDFGGALADAQLAGSRYALVTTTGWGVDYTWQRFSLRSLRTGKQYASLESNSGGAAPEEGVISGAAYGEIEEVVTTRTGAFAFLNDAGAVFAVDGAGVRRLVASGATDLASAGKRIYWTVGDAPFTERLTGRAKV